MFYTVTIGSTLVWIIDNVKSSKICVWHWNTKYKIIVRIPEVQIQMYLDLLFRWSLKTIMHRVGPFYIYQPMRFTYLFEFQSCKTGACMRAPLNVLCSFKYMCFLILSLYFYFYIFKEKTTRLFKIIVWEGIFRPANLEWTTNLSCQDIMSMDILTLKLQGTIVYKAKIYFSCICQPNSINRWSHQWKWIL